MQMETLKGLIAALILLSVAELLPTFGLPKMGPVDQSWITMSFNYSLPEILKYICILTLQCNSTELCICSLVCSLLLHTVTHTCMDESKLVCLTLLAAPTLQANRTGLLHILTKWGIWPFYQSHDLQDRGKKIIWGERNGHGCVYWSRGPEQRRRELYALIVLHRRRIEDDREAFPWECCCVLLEQMHSLISCLERNKHWQLIWRGVSLDLVELHKEATEP